MLNYVHIQGLGHSSHIERVTAAKLFYLSLSLSPSLPIDFAVEIHLNFCRFVYRMACEVVI